MIRSSVEITVWQLVFCALTIVVAFTVRGAAGFGGGALAVPLLALALPVHVVVPVVTVLTAIASAEHGVRHSSKILWRQLGFLFPFVLLGVTVGLYLLNELHATVLRQGLGAFVIAYAVFAFLTSTRPVRLPAVLLRPLGGVLAAIAGFVGTTFGGAAGPLFAIYYGNLGLDAAVFRVTITTTLLMMAGLRIVGYAGLGLFDRPTLTVLSVGLPFMWLGGRLAERVAGRIAAPAFNRVVGATLLVSGAALLLK